MGATDDAIGELREAESLDDRIREIVAPRERTVSADEYGTGGPLQFRTGPRRLGSGDGVVTDEASIDGVPPSIESCSVTAGAVGQRMD
jgi:hypothetical protein